MPDRSPYSVLGISPAASWSEVGGAYRDLASRLHPAVNAGAGAARVAPLDRAGFDEVRSAYEALRHPAARRAWEAAHAPYSGRRHRARFRGAAVNVTHAAYADARQARALAPDLGLTMRLPAGDAVSLSASLTSARRDDGLVDTFLDALDLFAAGFVHEGPSTQADRLVITLVLTPAEAAHGGELSFTIPLHRRDGSRVEPELHVLVPPGVHDGQRASLRLEPFGAARGEVTIYVRIE